MSEKHKLNCWLKRTNLDIIALVVVAALAEKAMGDDPVDVKLVQDGVGVLIVQADQKCNGSRPEINEPCSETP